MSKSAANEETLGALHNKVAKVMTNALDVFEAAQDAYLEKEDKVDEIVPEISASLLGVITKFLNDNKISCVGTESQEMSDLEQRLKNKQRKRVGNVVHAFGTDE